MEHFLPGLRTRAQVHPWWAFFCACIALSLISSAIPKGRNFIVETVAMFFQAVRGQPVRRLPRDKKEREPLVSMKVTLTGAEPIPRKTVPTRPATATCRHVFRPVVSRVHGETVMARCRDCGKRISLPRVPRQDEDGRCAHSRVVPVGNAAGETVAWRCTEADCGKPLGPDYASYLEDIPPEAKELQDLKR